MKRDFLAIADLSTEELTDILELAERLKRELKSGQRTPLLAGKTLAMIFEKPSLRTRVTFQVGMAQLGGYTVYLTPADISLGERETVADIARNLERVVDFIMARTMRHDSILELARHAAGTPVINGLSDLLHPCQVLSDCFTIREHRGTLKKQKVAFLGDGNNMANSWISAAARLGFTFALACPPGYEPDRGIVDRARDDGGEIIVTHDPAEALGGADIAYTDVWASMGQEDEAETRKKVFAPYQLDQAALERAKNDALVMHCLPAHRGEEVTEEVIEGPASIVFDQAENRLHVQKAILVWLNDQLLRRA